MKQSRTPNFRRLIIIAVVLIILSTVMVFWAQDVIREVIVLPLSYLFWVFGIIVHVTPQIFFWIVLLLIVFQIVWRTLFGRKKVYASRPVFVDDISFSTSSGRAAYWAAKVNLLSSGRSNYYITSFHNALTHLVLELLSYRYRQPVRVIEDQLRDDSLRVPPEVREYVLSHNNRQEGSYRGFWAELWQSLEEKLLDFWDRITAKRVSSPAVVDPQLAFILNYLEEELEVPHDDSSH